MQTDFVYLICAAIIAGVCGVEEIIGRNVDDRVRFGGRIRPQLPVPGSRIINGQEAAVGQFPHQVGLVVYLKQGKAWCGGSLISPRFAITAAHCGDDALGIDVLLGYTNRTDTTEKGQEVLFIQKKNIILHEKWDRLTLANDIALLKLPADIDFNEFVQPVNLPSKEAADRTYEEELAIASGWGIESDSSPYTSPVLRWIEVPVMPNSGCSRYYFGTIKNTHICTRSGSAHLSTCSGDSGGPLIHKDSKTLIGLTSFGIALGCERGWPSVFTRVAPYVDWIHANTDLN